MRRESANTGEPLDPAIVGKPKLHFGLALYFNAFWDLDTERDRNELERIKRSACFEYAYDYDFTEDQKEDLWYYIARMDKAFLAYWRTKLPKK